MKDRLFTAGTLVGVIALLLGIGTPRLGAQSGSDVGIPELRAGPRIPAGAGIGQSETTEAEVPQVQGGRLSIESEAAPSNATCHW